MWRSCAPRSPSASPRRGRGCCGPRRGRSRSRRRGRGRAQPARAGADRLGARGRSASSKPSRSSSRSRAGPLLVTPGGRLGRPSRRLEAAARPLPGGVVVAVRPLRRRRATRTSWPRSTRTGDLRWSLSRPRVRYPRWGGTRVGHADRLPGADRRAHAFVIGDGDPRPAARAGRCLRGRRAALASRGPAARVVVRDGRAASSSPGRWPRGPVLGGDGRPRRFDARRGAASVRRRSRVRSARRGGVRGRAGAGGRPTSRWSPGSGATTVVALHPRVGRRALGAVSVGSRASSGRPPSRGSRGGAARGSRGSLGSAPCSRRRRRPGRPHRSGRCSAGGPVLGPLLPVRLVGHLNGRDGPPAGQEG